MLMALNYAFLGGNLWSTFSHAAPLDIEIAELVPGLKRLHEYGLLTTNSQPFQHEFGARGGQF